MSNSLIIDVITKFLSDKSPRLEEIPDLLRITRTSSLKKGVLIYKQGKIPKKLALIVTGLTRWFYLDEIGKEHTAKFASDLEPSVPLIELEENIPSHYSVVTLVPTRVVWVDRDKYFWFIEKYPRYQVLAKEKLNESLLEDIKWQKLLRIPTAKERYKALLEEKPELVKCVPLIYLASFLDITPETLSRIRAKIS